MGQQVRTSEARRILGGRHRNTLLRWEELGKLHPIRHSDNGNRFYDTDELNALKGIEPPSDDAHPDGVAIYCRVSSTEQKQKGDLDRQKLRLLEYCASKHYRVDYVVEDVGSGMNDKRKKLLALMRQAKEHKFSKLVIEHYDRLTRFNYNFMVEYFNSHGVKVEYVEEVLNDSFEAELVKDMLSLITVFSAKLYGQRSKRNRKVSIKERYQRIAETDEFKKAYDGMSIGETMEIENP